MRLIWLLAALVASAAQAASPWHHKRQNETTSLSSSAPSLSNAPSSSIRSTSRRPSSSIKPSSSSSPRTTTTTKTTTPTPSSSSEVSSSAPSSSSSSPASSASSVSRTAAFAPTPTPPPSGGDVGSSDLATTSDDSEPEEPTSSPASDEHSNSSGPSGFLSNKAAVGATFTVVGLVVVGILFFVLKTARNRQQSHNSARDTFFDSKTPYTAETEQPSNASMVSLGAEPMDAHSTPIHNYGGTQYLVDTNDYNAYPPGASYNQPAAAQQQYNEPVAASAHQAYQAQEYYADNSAHQAGDAYYADNMAYDTYNQYYSDGQPAAVDPYQQTTGSYSVAPADRAPSISPHPYSHPAHMSGTPAAVARPFAGRDSGYPQSLDSFYGASGTAM